jgi:hypothetical protein
MKQTILTDALRKEICHGDSYSIRARRLTIYLVESVEHDWDDKKGPTLKKVIHDLVDEAYYMGIKAGKEEVRKTLRLALFGNGCANIDSSDPRL